MKTYFINISIGKISFETKNIAENAVEIINAVIKAKPASAKGKYLEKLVISATMNHGLKLDVEQF